MTFGVPVWTVTGSHIGVHTEGTLRKEVNAAKVLVALVTPNSLSSAFVQFEVGARWGAESFIAPLLVGMKPEQVPAPLSYAHSLQARGVGHLLQFVEDIAKRLGRTTQKPSSYNKQIVALKGLASTLPNRLKGEAPYTPSPPQRRSRGLFRKDNIDAFPELKAYIDSNRVHKATLIQMSCTNEKDLIKALWRKEAKVELFLSSGGQEFGVSDYQRERIEEFVDQLQNELSRFKVPESGEIAIYKYAAPASIRAVLIDDKILAFGPYLYEVYEVGFGEKKRKLLDVRGAELPLLVLRKADPDFKMISELINHLIKTWKTDRDWKEKCVAKHVVTIQPSDLKLERLRDLVKLWRET